MSRVSQIRLILLQTAFVMSDFPGPDGSIQEEIWWTIVPKRNTEHLGYFLELLVATDDPILFNHVIRIEKRSITNQSLLFIKFEEQVLDRLSRTIGAEISRRRFPVGTRGIPLI